MYVYGAEVFAVSAIQDCSCYGCVKQGTVNPVKKLNSDKVAAHVQFCMLCFGQTDCFCFGNTLSAGYCACWGSATQAPEFPVVNEVTFCSVFGTLTVHV